RRPAPAAPAAAPPPPAPAPAAAGGGTARYDMRAGTVSGVAAQGGRGGLGMMMGGGGGNSVQHELLLRLGSGRAADRGAPKADHFMPPAAQLGRSVALVSPREERSADELPQKPKGRMLIYWGCGEHAPKGQPVVIDFSKLAAGQVPPGLWSTTIVRDWGPTLQNSRSFARWPAEDGKYVRSDSSLPGPHRVSSNFAPEISFTLANDFMQPLRSRTMNLPGGAKNLMWTGIPQATGYVASLFGGSMNDRGDMGDMVMWSSSFTRQFGGGLADWLSPGQVAALVRDRTVLPPTATSCTIPAEVIRDAGQFRMGTLTAFGPEENFSYPPRPAGARAYVPDWTARIRHRSTTSWMDMAGMGGMMGGQGANGRDDDEGGRPARNCTPRRGGLGGMLGGLGGGRQSGC
ncbi:MAG: hypothetical protein QM676_12750, partial [Novosphingobium sp.]